MAVCCAKCDKDCTTLFATAKVKKPFTCPRCGSADFVEREIEWEDKLSYNDRKLLKKSGIVPK